MDDLFSKNQFGKILILSAAFFLTAAGFAFAQITVKGTVSDTQSNPLVGVTVMGEGKANGTSTDADGKYAWPGVKKGYTLLYSCIVMAGIRVTVDGTLTTINIALNEDNNFLNEAVVVGYVTQQKAI